MENNKRWISSGWGVPASRMEGVCERERVTAVLRRSPNRPRILQKVGIAWRAHENNGGGFRNRLETPGISLIDLFSVIPRAQVSYRRKRLPALAGDNDSQANE